MPEPKTEGEPAAEAKPVVPEPNKAAATPQAEVKVAEVVPEKKRGGGGCCGGGKSKELEAKEGEGKEGEGEGEGGGDGGGEGGGDGAHPKDVKQEAPHEFDGFLQGKRPDGKRRKVRTAYRTFHSM